MMPTYKVMSEWKTGAFGSRGKWTAIQKKPLDVGNFVFFISVSLPIQNSAQL
jgi:hypothetical protein